VAFASDATNFAALDAGTDRDVYVHDFGSGATFLASQGGGAKANASSADASISGDGVKIAFTTNATNLSGADTNGYSDVYVRDTSMLGGTTLASRCQGGALLTLPAVQGAIAPTGTRVSFTTATVGCTPQADPDFVQVFSRGLGLAPVGVELTSWISRPSGSGDFKSGTNHSALHGFFRSTDTPSALSADGSVAAFVSEADEMSPDDHDRVPNVFVRDARTGATELMSRASGVDGAAGNGPSGPNLFGGGLALSGSVTTPPSISDDGRYVAFTSLADNLVPNDNNGRSDVFVRDRVTQTTTLVSVGSDEAQINESSYDSDISADGTRIAFTSKARFDQAVDLTTAPSVYVRDLAAGTTTLVSRQNGANGASANDDADAPAISGDGKRVVFETAATNLAPSLIDNNSVGDVYMRDLGTDATSIVSIRNGLPSAGNHGGGSADIDANGTHVAFASSSDNLVGAGDANGASDVFVRTIGTPDVVLVSKGPGGAAGNGFSIGPSISADGTRVAFSTGATDLFSGDTNQAIDVLLRDLTAGTTTLVSRADGADGALPNATSEYATISADGHCVAFDSQAGNLVAGLSGTDFIHGYLRAIDADCGTPPPGSPPPGPAPGPAPDTTAPVLSGLKLTPATFRLGAKPTAVSTAKTPPKGTKIRFTLSEAASVSLRIERKTKGHRKGRKCVAKRKTGKRCTRYVLKGTLKRSGKAGVNSVAFSGRIGKRKLAKGRYRVVVRATDAAGNRSAKKTAAFRIV
jgi:Tol biopolymer transport system component